MTAARPIAATMDVAGHRSSTLARIRSVSMNSIRRRMMPLLAPISCSVSSRCAS